MILIVGLGNPGEQYEKTRHNAGFMALDLLADSWKIEKSLNAILAKKEIKGEKCVLCKPLTYMNDSGLAVAKLAKQLKVSPGDIIVVQDELDLPVGQIKINFNRSAGGHKGVKSIINHLGSQEFARVRIGIGKPEDPKKEIADFVLEEFNKEQREKIKEALQRSTQAIEDMIAFGIDEAANRYNKKA